MDATDAALSFYQLSALKVDELRCYNISTSCVQHRNRCIMQYLLTVHDGVVFPEDFRGRERIKGKVGVEINLNQGQPGPCQDVVILFRGLCHDGIIYTSVTPAD